MDRKNKIGMAIVVLFATPFALFGVFGFVLAWKQANGGPGNAPLFVPIILGLVFSGVGFGLLYLAFARSKSIARENTLEAQHPGEPWLWREDWAQGRVASKTRTNLVISWVFAIFWNLISTPTSFAAIQAVLSGKGSAGVFLVFLFPALGLYLLVNAVRQSLAYLEFGKTFFEMASVPVVIGRELKGTIQARFPHSPEHGVHLRVSCVHRVTTSSGNSSTTSERILWREECDLGAEQLSPGPLGTTIPVAFLIPRDAQPTEKINVRDEYVWLLEAMADVPGVNYHDIFELPVFRTSATPTGAEEADEPAASFRTGLRSGLVTAGSRPEHWTVRVSQVAEGTEFYFPAARNKSAAALTTLFAVLFGGAAYFLTAVRAPILFPIVFGGFSCLIAYIALQLCLGTSRVVIGTSMKVQSGILGLGRMREVALSNISSIEEKIGMQQGGATGTAFYDIVLWRRDGGLETLGSAVASKRESEWLVGEMQRLAGLNSEPAGARVGASAAAYGV